MWRIWIGLFLSPILLILINAIPNGWPTIDQCISLLWKHVIMVTVVTFILNGMLKKGKPEQ